MKITRRLTGRDVHEVIGTLGLNSQDIIWILGSMHIKRSTDTADKPLKDPAICILIRTLLAYPELNPLPQMPEFKEIVSLVKKHGRKNYKNIMNKRQRIRGQNPQEPSSRFVALLLGRSGWSGNNWINKPNHTPAPVVLRLMYLFEKIVNQCPSEGFEQYFETVMQEARSRGMTSFNDLIDNGATWPERGIVGLLEGPDRRVLGKDTQDIINCREMTSQDLNWTLGSIHIKRTGKKGNQPIKDPAQSLLIRLMKKNPDLSILPELPSFQEMTSLVEQYGKAHQDQLRNKRKDSKKTRGRRPKNPNYRFTALLFGRSGWSGHDYINNPSHSASPASKRLFYIFKQLVKNEGRLGFEKYFEIVMQEVNARGFDDFKQLIDNNSKWPT